MTEAFHIQIISPASVVVDAHVPSAQIPGLEGDFGVLPGHAPFFSMIRPGVIEQFNRDIQTYEWAAAHVWGQAKVRRGASLATRLRMKHPTWRGYALPGQDLDFVGFRSCGF